MKTNSYKFKLHSAFKKAINILLTLLGSTGLIIAAAEEAEPMRLQTILLWKVIGLILFAGSILAARAINPELKNIK